MPFTYWVFEEEAQPEAESSNPALNAQSRYVALGLCTACAKLCAAERGFLRDTGLFIPKKAIPELAQTLRNHSSMKTTLLTTETFTPDITELYTRYYKFVTRVCIRYVQNHDEAEDMAQEVFLKAGNAWQAFAGQSQPSTWLYRIAVNHCLDYLRQKKRQRDLMVSYSISLEKDNEEEMETPSTMRQILDQLGEEMDTVDTQVLYLRFELGFTHGAIAEICGVSRVAITKRLSKIHTRATDLYRELAKNENETLRAAA